MTDHPKDNLPFLRRSAVYHRLAAAFIFLLGLTLILPLNIYPSLQIIGEDFNFVDDSWSLGLPARLVHGELAGRDFAFTYGPLYQATHALGLLIPPHDAASLLRFEEAIDSLLTVLCVWVMLRFTDAPFIWRASLYLLWMCFYPVAIVKPLAGILLVMVCGRALATESEGGHVRRNMAAVTCWIASPIALLLYSFDLGVMTLLALLLTAFTMGVGAWWSAGKLARFHVLRIGMTAATAVAGVIFFAVILTVVASGWNGYLKDSWEIASGYTNMMAIGITRIYLLTMIAAVALCGGVILFLMSQRTWASGRVGYVVNKRAVGMLAAACFCIVWMRYGLTRSDAGHVLGALVPTILLTGCLLPCYLRAQGSKFARFALVAVVPLILLSPIHLPLLLPAVPANPLRRLAAIRKLELRGTRLHIEHDGFREAATLAATLPDDSLYVWPYEVMLNVVSGKANPSYTLQSYVALTDRLERATVARLEAIPDLPVIIFTNSWAIDNVENLTRTPLIFRYLLEQYELADSPRATFALLRRRDSSSERRWQAQELPVAAASLAPGNNRSLTINLAGDSSIDCRASDMLALQLRASQTRMFGIGKPGYITIIFTLSNGERRTQRLLLAPDGDSHEVLVSAMTASEPLFLGRFAPDVWWRSQEQVTGVEINWWAMDRLSRRPQEIELQRLSVVRPTRYTEIRERPLAEQDRTVFYRPLDETNSIP